VLIQKLKEAGIKKACGKSLKDASLTELQDEWGGYELQQRTRPA
jgi:hypothetical protein